MRRNQVAVVGAAETTELGVIPNVSQIQLHADAALNAIADAGLKLSDIDGFATAVETPQQIAHYLGITPTWVDGTSVGGCSFMLHVRHAAAAIEAGLCKTVLITHAESGKSMIGQHPAPDRPRQPERPVRAALRGDDACQHVSDSGAALHEDPRHHPRADRDGRGGAARMGREESACHHEGADHRRGRAELADDRLSVPHPAMLPRHRRRRCADPDIGRPRPGFPEKAGLYPRHRRKRGNADGQPDADLRQFARLQGRRPARLQGSRHRAQATSTI